MLDHVVHFPADDADTAPSHPTPANRHPSGSQCLTLSEGDMEIRVRNITTGIMDAATGDSFLLKHLLADMHIVRGNQETLLAQIKHGLLEPSQADVHFRRIEDGSNMSLKRKKDFLQRMQRR